MNFRTPLRKARGLGSAKEGLHQWWAQRVTAIALIPLALWFAFSLVMLPDASYADAVGWITAPWNTVLLIAFIIAAFYHAILGLQVVFEDYIHPHWLKITSILAVNLLLGFLALASLLAILRIVFVS